MTARRLVSRAVALLAVGVALASMSADTHARELRIATWNLGWHMDAALARDWIAACSRPFVRSPGDSLWRPAGSGPAAAAKTPAPDGPRPGWSLKWGRDARIEWDIGVLPPCDVYQANFRIVPVTPAAYAVRHRQIRDTLARQIDADILALQEVSGALAVREVLPDGGRGYEVCSYEGHKVQRLAIAWRRTVGQLVSCTPHWPLSLPANSSRDQPRPGLALTLKVDGRLLRVLTVHLKSSCVSPLETGERGQGQLDGAEANCRILQQQVPALEAWLENQSAGVDGLILLGDFNRNLPHEAQEATGAPVRSAGRPTDPHTPGNRVRNLWREVNDGQPRSSSLILLKAACQETVDGVELCEAAKGRVLQREETARLANSRGLGCRNPLGLDHIAVSSGVQAASAAKVPIGLRGRTSAATDVRPDPLLAMSDHCPLLATVRFP